MYHTHGRRDFPLPPSLGYIERWLEPRIDTFVYFTTLAHLLNGSDTLPLPSRRPLQRLVRNITFHRHDTVSGGAGRVRPLPLLSGSVWIFRVADEGIHITAVHLETRTSGMRQMNTTRNGVVAMLDSVLVRVREEIMSGARSSSSGWTRCHISPAMASRASLQSLSPSLPWAASTTVWKCSRSTSTAPAWARVARPRRRSCRWSKVGSTK